MNYVDVVQNLEARGVMPKGPPSLDRVGQGLDRLKINIDPSKVILIAGTNGKGSTGAALESLLISAGKDVGFYTSPHLVNTTERIRINQTDISRTEFVDCFNTVSSKTHGIELTHFEMLTLMAVEYFFSGAHRTAVDYAILEVGLGGTWDATNCVPHKTSLIAKIAQDHEHILGKTLPEIAGNKFGIIKKDNLVVHQPFDPDVFELAKEVQNKTNSHWISCKNFDYSVSNRNRPGFTPEYWLHTPWGTQKNQLIGLRGAENSMLALTAFEALGFSPERHLSALERVRWGGRMEPIFLPQHQRTVYLSGDHNPNGIQSLLEVLKNYSYKKCRVVAGVGSKKDVEQILDPLLQQQDNLLYLTETPFQGLSMQEYPEKIKQAAFYQNANPENCLRQAIKDSAENDLILVTGSLYLVGEIKGRFLSG